jgi:hypothetical protein
MMTTTTIVFGLLGAGFGAGLWLIIAGWRMPSSHRPRPRWWRRPSEPQIIRGATAAGAGVLGGVLTGWLASVPLTVAAVLSLPKLLGRDTPHADRTDRIEAIATWTEMLRDTLAAAAGIEQAILASARLAPKAIHDEVAALATQLESGARLAPSLRHFADDLSDPTADLVVSSLVLASTQQARQVGELLGSLAATARKHAAMRMRIETSRSRTRTTVRIIVGTTVTFAATLAVLSRDYLAVYDSATGQLVLLAAGALFACSFAWLTRIAAVAQPARVLAQTGNKDLVCFDNKDISL